MSASGGGSMRLIGAKRRSSVSTVQHKGEKMVRLFSNRASMIFACTFMIGLIILFVGVPYYLQATSIQYFCLYYEPDGAARSHRSVVSTLNSLVQGQTQLKHDVILDKNGNRVGEYGSFPELIGLASSPQYGLYFSPAISQLNKESGVFQRGAYSFKMYLSNEIHLRECYWMCIAWGAIQ